MSKRNDKSYEVLLDLKRTSQYEMEGQEIYLPAWWQLEKGQDQESSGSSFELTCSDTIQEDKGAHGQAVWRQVISALTSLDFSTSWSVRAGLYDVYYDMLFKLTTYMSKLKKYIRNSNTLRVQGLK